MTNELKNKPEGTYNGDVIGGSSWGRVNPSGFFILKGGTKKCKKEKTTDEFYQDTCKPKRHYWMNHCKECLKKSKAAKQKEKTKLTALKNKAATKDKEACISWGVEQNLVFHTCTRVIE